MHENQESLHSQLEHNRLEFEQRRYRYERLMALVDSLEREGRVDAEVLMAYRVVATELALGGELRELKQLREENRKLKSLVADLSLDKTILQEAIRKKW